MTAASMLAQMRKMLGWGEPNAIHTWYAARNGAEFRPGSVPWCQMTVSWAAYHSGNYDAVCPRGDRAYTVYGADDGRSLGLWHAGTPANIKKYAKPGAIVYFDWDGTDVLGRVDHVGVVERNLGDGRVQTLEGNSDNRGVRRVRGAGVIAGFWNPDYEEDDVALSDADLKKIADKVYERFSHKVSETHWASRVGILDPDQNIDPRGALRQIWAYTKSGYHSDQEILATLAALQTAVSELATVRDVDADALMARIREAIEGVTVRLDVTDDAE